MCPENDSLFLGSWLDGRSRLNDKLYCGFFCELFPFFSSFVFALCFRDKDHSVIRDLGAHRMGISFLGARNLTTPTTTRNISLDKFIDNLNRNPTKSKMSDTLHCSIFFFRFPWEVRNLTSLLCAINLSISLNLVLAIAGSGNPHNDVSLPPVFGEPEDGGPRAAFAEAAVADESFGRHRHPWTVGV